MGVACQPTECHLPADTWYMVFDTETSGLHATSTIVQIAYAIYARDGRELMARSRILQMKKGEYIAKGARDIHHIDIARTRREGVSPGVELTIFKRLFLAMRACNRRVVAHNERFDRVQVVRCGAKYGVTVPIEEGDIFCTMRASKDHVLARNVRGHLKVPSNAELYRALHKGNEPPGQLHDALTDIRVSAASYAAGLKRGWFHDP
jgi:DNA polymerase III epsilon subunit-like protein